MSTGNLSFIHPDMKIEMVLAAGTTALSCGALFAPWEPVRTVALTILAGVATSFLTYIYGQGESDHRFTVKTVPYEKDPKDRVVRNSNAYLTALLVGMYNDNLRHLCGGIFLATLSNISLWGSVRKVSASRLAPFVCALGIISFLAGHLRERRIKRLREEHEALEPRLRDREIGYPIPGEVRFESSKNVSLIGVGAIGLAILLVRYGILPKV